MKKLLLIVAVVLAMLFAYGQVAKAEPLSTEEAAAKLVASTAQVREGYDSFCTAWKIGDYEWATAAHCVRFKHSGIKLKTAPTELRKWGYNLEIKSKLVPMEEREIDFKPEDWAIFYVTDATPDIPALTIDCTYKPVLGERVAYFGTPKWTKSIGWPMFDVGIISNIEEGKPKEFGWDWGAQLNGTPGVSGSAVMSMKTGDVVGLFTHGLPHRSAGLVISGVSSVSYMDRCDPQTKLSTTDETQDDKGPF